MGRFIPTPVGNSCPATARPRRPSVYPHARGELSSTRFSALQAAGLSPRPWGTYASIVGGSNCRRFIPTPVGNSGPAGEISHPLTVYPHARGELGRRAAVYRLSPGLSPRPWGTPLGAIRSVNRDRFIPTPVGNSADPGCASACVAVYPHARGELGAAAASGSGAFGLSPPPWGTPKTAQVIVRPCRFIPTPVGNSTLLTAHSAISSVYPHARGELVATVRDVLTEFGLSPRPWGTLAHETRLGWG